ncbi:MAG: hypothetical protein H6739_28850 [Alphaproteobacteria bacterium]|nr:hypothetical protein [Alphaproteobacteria bacterium]
MRHRLLPLAVLALVSCTSGSGTTPAPSPAPTPIPTPAPMTDAQLIAAVQAAAAASVSPQDATAKVGETPWITTTKAGDREIALAAEIEFDADQTSAISDLGVQKDFAYWGRPGTWDNPRVVGLAWPGDGTSLVWFGVIYPP